MNINQLNSIPDGLLDCEATELHDLLGGPTLIHLQGRRDPALFISVLMHGNETTGWTAVQALLKKYYANSSVEERPRSLSLFIANTEAAASEVRHLPNQQDFNRVWPGSELEFSPAHELMQFVVDEMRIRGVFASVDVHNNTGLNPHYACVNNLDWTTLKLATLFSRIVVFFTRPVGVQSMAMSQLCPAVTLECGKVGQDAGAEHALTYLDACIHLSEIPDSPVSDHDIDLFHTTATVKIAEHTSYGFAGENLELQLVSELEKYNFRELNPGTIFGHVGGNKPTITVTTEQGKDGFSDYFEVNNQTLITRKKVMPSMLTSNLEVISQDCLCYLMERYSLPE